MAASNFGLFRAPLSHLPAGIWDPSTPIWAPLAPTDFTPLLPQICADAWVIVALVFALWLWVSLWARVSASGDDAGDSRPRPPENHVGTPVLETPCVCARFGALSTAILLPFLALVWGF